MIARKHVVRVIALAFALIILSAATALLVVGIRNHTEPGLIENVPQFNRSQFPLRVALLDYSGGNPLRAKGETLVAGQSVILDANHRLGFPAFRDAGEVEPGTTPVFVIFGMPLVSTNEVNGNFDQESLDPGEGSARLLKTGAQGDATCAIAISSSVVRTDMVYMVLYHELGHCLGLAHDDSDISIMRRSQHPANGFFPSFTDSDRELLRGMYGPR